MPPDQLPASPSFVTQLLSSLPAARLPQGSAAPASGTVSVFSAANSAPPPPPTLNASPNLNLNPLAAVTDGVRKQLLALHVLFPNEFLPALDLLDRRLVTRFRVRRDGDGRVKEGAGASETQMPQSTASTHVVNNPNTEEVPTTTLSGAQDLATPPSAESALNAATSAAAAGDGQIDSPDAEMLDVGSAIPQADEAEELHPNTPSAPRANDPPIQEAQQQKSPDAVYYVRSAQQRSSRYSSSYDSTTSYEVRLHAWNCSCPAFAFSAFPSTMHKEPPALHMNLNDLNDFNDLDAKTGLSDTTQEQDHGWRFGGVRLGDAMPPVCKHILACVLVERCGMFKDFVEEKDVSVEEAAGWAAGWGD